MKKLKECIENYLTLMGICTLTIFIMCWINYIPYKETAIYFKASLITSCILAIIMTFVAKKR